MGEPEKPHFPLPQCYWEQGNKPNYRTCVTQFKNYIFRVNLDRTDAQQLNKEYKNRLLYSLLGVEGTLRFANQPLAHCLAETDHTVFAKAISDFFAKPVNELCAEFDFQNCLQRPGESCSNFLVALRTLLVDLNMDGQATQECMLAKQLVYSCRDPNILKQLLEIGQVDFAQIYNKFLALEKTDINASIIHSGSSFGQAKATFLGHMWGKSRNRGMDSLVEGATVNDHLDLWTHKPKSCAMVVDETVTRFMHSSVRPGRNRAHIATKSATSNIAPCRSSVMRLTAKVDQLRSRSICTHRVRFGQLLTQQSCYMSQCLDLFVWIALGPVFPTSFMLNWAVVPIAQ